ncbi:MAG: hypothetical protein ACJ77A_10785 [Actinomycetota bacterium]
MIGGAPARRRLLGAAVVIGLLAAACSSGSSPGTDGAPASRPAVGPPPASSPGAATTPTGALPGLNTGPAPWPPEIAHLGERLRAIGLPPLGPEALRVHFHVNLVVFVLGRQVPVPVGIGIQLRPLALAEIHTHSGSGTIHVEAARPRHFTLGMVFDVWGVLFSGRCLGGYCRRGPDRIRVFVDGHAFGGDPTELDLGDGQVIVVAFGTADELPHPMPARFVYEGPPQA